MRQAPQARRPPVLGPAAFLCAVAVAAYSGWWELVWSWVAANPVVGGAVAAGVAVLGVLFVAGGAAPAGAGAGRVSGVGGLQGVDALSPSGVEQLVSDLMVSAGCRVRVSGGAGDGGVDVSGVMPDGRRVVVQVKKYRGPVGPATVRELNGVPGAEVRVLVTSSVLTVAARSFARDVGIVVVDRAVLGRWLRGELPPFLW